MTSRRGLGRGLDALLPDVAAGEVTTVEGFPEAAIDDIDPNPNQPRGAFDDSALAELTASITQLGLLQPLVVRPLGNRFELVAGERRLRAAKRAGLTSVPVVIVETDATGSLERALVENLHREDLNPIEEAAAYRQLIDEGGLTQEALGARLGRSRVTIANTLRLLDLPAEVQRMLVEKRLSAGHGKALLGLEKNPFQKRLAERVVHEGLSVRELEDLVRRYQQMVDTQPAAKPGSRARPPLVADAQRALADRLQARVRVRMGKRKGQIVVDFASLEELQRLLDEIIGTNRPTVTTVVPG